MSGTCVAGSSGRHSPMFGSNFDLSSHAMCSLIEDLVRRCCDLDRATCPIPSCIASSSSCKTPWHRHICASPDSTASESARARRTHCKTPRQHLLAGPCALTSRKRAGVSERVCDRLTSKSCRCPNSGAVSRLWRHWRALASLTCKRSSLTGERK